MEFSIENFDRLKYRSLQEDTEVVYICDGGGRYFKFLVWQNIITTLYKQKKFYWRAVFTSECEGGIV